MALRVTPRRELVLHGLKETPLPTGEWLLEWVVQWRGQKLVKSSVVPKELLSKQDELWVEIREQLALELAER